MQRLEFTFHRNKREIGERDKKKISGLLEESDHTCKEQNKTSLKGVGFGLSLTVLILSVLLISATALEC